MKFKLILNLCTTIQLFQFACISTVPLQSAKTLPKGAHNLTVQIGEIKPDGNFSTKDTGQPIQKAEELSGWSLTYRIGIIKWLELGAGCGFLPDAGFDAHCHIRIPLLPSSAGTASPYLNSSRFGLSIFGAAASVDNGYFPNSCILYSAGLTTSFDWLKFPAHSIKSALISGCEYGYMEFGWSWFKNWDREGQVLNQYGVNSKCFIVPFGISIDFKGMSLGVDTRFIFPLTKDFKFESENYDNSYIIGSEFNECRIIAFRYSQSFRLKKND
jgi:hypothetical protein